ncbi:MAG: GDP-mannose 4,6-dehydratase [Candidatus Rokubacteria bacterium]|nr:GDP-mannose 4,6-dehydratase [Candidatus Rokubacteria bacterium]
MNTLVTGGAGFIGSHLTEALLEAGHAVAVVDDLSTGRGENLAAVAGSARLRAHWASILEDERLQELVDEADVVYHLAAAVGVRLILERPVETIETNILGTDRVLRSAAKEGKKVVIASTSEVYGKNDRVPLREDDDGVLGPTTKSRWSYACSKAIDEFLGLAYHRNKGVPVVIVRYFNTIGPRQIGRYGMVVPRFVQQALAGEPITVFGDGHQSRSFTDVADAVRATIGLSLDSRAVGEVFNVGSGREITINELAARVRDLAGSRSEIVHVPYDRAYEAGFEDLRRRVPDVTKLRETIDFSAEVDLDTSLRKIIGFYRGKPGPS